MPEYRALRERHSLLDICRTPELATTVTLQPLRRIEVDAAILFSDLLLPLAPMGLPFDFVKGEGPSIERPVRSEADIERLEVFEPREALAHVQDTVRLVQTELDGRLPLIGFGGAPFTLASYAIEGGHSANFARTKTLMYGAPAGLAFAVREIVDRRQRVSPGSNRGRRGCRSALRFLGGRARRARLRRVCDAAHTANLRGPGRDPCPNHSFRHRHRMRSWAACVKPAATSLGQTGGLDWTKPGIESGTIAPSRAIWIPPCSSRPLERLLAGADEVLERAGGRPGHIFNLGHGILPGTPVEHVQLLARHVHQRSRSMVRGSA